MISESKWQSLRARMASLGISENDLLEHFVRSGGHGGQNVNKLNTCVWIKHVPTSLEVKCQKTRHQVDNRYFARQILCDKVDQKIHGEKSRVAKERFKIRKQKQKRSKRAKEKMLEGKRHRSETKRSREKPQNFD